MVDAQQQSWPWQAANDKAGRRLATWNENKGQESDR